MKRLIRGLLLVVCVLAVLLGAGVAFLYVKKPAQRAPSAEKIEATPARLARGAYLAEHVVDCLMCHSQGKFDRYGIPRVPGTEGKGGFAFGKDFDIPGIVYARNITPDPETGIGAWTDGEILRAMREGVDRHGNALFPMMPYAAYHEMSDEDARAIVVYMRALRPVRNAVPPKKVNFPVNLLIKGAPKPVEGVLVAPDPKDAVAYGQVPHDHRGLPGLPHARVAAGPADSRALLQRGKDVQGAVGAQRDAEPDAAQGRLPRPRDEGGVHRALPVLRERSRATRLRSRRRGATRSCRGSPSPARRTRTSAPSTTS